ncbi:hypothetical protein [Bradyrhizobium sp. SZCCHNR1051]|uniref:hypothetical protein n=1 Tax=Bradyrhizobium sp. SZCCHNR1051 TaxID=3057355 RepID=UPI002916DC22|nr:hypothetical protein [Bradyrhizobium sp. SZCCHNR1051]
MTDKCLCLVFDTQFGERLRDIDSSSPIWIVQSKDNGPIVSDLWQANVGNITSFKPQNFDLLLGTVDEHHPGWSELEVIGIKADAAKGTLEQYGNGEVRETTTGFHFTRDSGALS